MPRSFSVAQINSLGERLRRPGTPEVVDLEMLQRLRLDYDPPLDEVGRVLRERLGLQATSRLKTIGTIVDKLRRERTRLSTMQDIAGARIVVNGGLARQDAVARAIDALFFGAKVVDRRSRPSHGYRALHIIATVDECRVEIQVRTEIQDLWAQAVEKIADAWGRGIRYGEEPPAPEAPFGRGTRRQFVAALMQQSEIFAKLERLGARAAAGDTDQPAIEAEFAELSRQAVALLEDFGE